MDRQALTNMLAQWRQGHLPAAAELTPLIEDSTARQQLLEHPELVAALVAAAQAETGLDCAAVAEALAAYVDAEQAGQHLHPHYQPLRTHLQRCPVCYEDYSLVHTIIDAQQAGAVPRWPLQAHAGIVLSRAALNQTLRQPTPAPAPAWQIYAGPVPDLPALHASIELARLAADWQISVALRGSQAAGLRVMLRYESELRIEHSDAAGYAHFAQVPTRWICTADGPDLLLLFVADPQPSQT